MRVGIGALTSRVRVDLPKLVKGATREVEIYHNKHPSSENERKADIDANPVTPIQTFL